MIWTAKADSLLIRLWNEGGSLTTVARDMQRAGYEVSRGMVAGRKHRLSHHLFNRSTQPPQRQRSKAHVTMTTFKDSMGSPASVEEDDGVAYLAMENHHCRAILDRRDGDGLPMICGKPRTRGNEGTFSSSYCAFHLRAFHNMPGQRR